MPAMGQPGLVHARAIFVGHLRHGVASSIGPVDMAGGKQVEDLGPTDRILCQVTSQRGFPPPFTPVLPYEADRGGQIVSMTTIEEREACADCRRHQRCNRLRPHQAGAPLPKPFQRAPGISPKIFDRYVHESTVHYYPASRVSACLGSS